MQTADLQTRAWVSQTRTSVSQTSASVSQTSTPVSQNSTLVRLFMLAIRDGIGNTIYNLPVCSLQPALQCLSFQTQVCTTALKINQINKL